MQKIIIADELTGRGKASSDDLELIKQRGYEKYELDFTTYENETHVWDMPKIIEAVSKCDAVLFSKRIEDELPIYKVLYYLADGLDKTCLYLSGDIVSVDYFERLANIVDDICDDIKDEFCLLPEGLVRHMWHKTHRLRDISDEMLDWLLANLPDEVPDNYLLEELSLCAEPNETGCYVCFPSGLTEHFEDNEFDIERLRKLMEHCVQVNFSGDSEMFRRLQDVRSTKRS